MRRILPGGLPLIHSQIRGAVGDYLPVAPWLLRRPFDGVIAVVAFIDPRIPFAVRIVASAHILHQDRIAPSCEVERILLLASLPIRRTNQYDWVFPLFFGEV